MAAALGNSAPWQALVKEKQERQKATIPPKWLIELPDTRTLDVTSIPETCGLLSARELEITRSNVEVLLPRLASGSWSAVEVTTAFYKRAIIAHQLTNCLTEIFVDKALARAAALDEHLKTTGKVVGPLHGLPVSLKDQINIEGIEASMGYVSWLGKYATKNSVLVDVLLELGAVPFVKTNIPQTLMWPETFNHIFGRTSNPHNRSLTSGGSSGGEGALIGLRGSPLGVGSDIGGSVRIPSAFCGVYGLRPSYNRIPYGGCVNSMEGQDSVLSVLGPISNSIVGLKAFTQSVIESQPWLKDPLALRKRWSPEEYDLIEHNNGKNLCFAILWNDGLTVPHPPIIRGLETTKKALIAAGHTVIDWVPHKHGEIYETLRAVWAAGAAEDYAVTTSPTGEPVISTMSPDPDVAGTEASFRPGKAGISAYQLWQTQKRKRELREEYLAHWQQTAGTTGTGRPVDAIISPAAAYAAPPHGKNKNADYTMIWNLLDYTTMVIPISKVDPTFDVKKPAHEFLSDRDQINYDLYDPVVFANAPISIQVVGRTLEEEAVLALGKIVDDAVKALSTKATGKM
ncbi:hypothetical protein PLEOSDRAFT_1092424 [Pleurotus ostreatus PC15]|uniref:amidase n=1 Tax=Pleurotus ostreatus (strain PC15) TaxID=1137138 RepID=A0A067P3P5_PLEO1|nr:hypothetical protein PLEOSDRAFT_1092424 [Pleurotus ostreatus PC15]